MAFEQSSLQVSGEPTYQRHRLGAKGRNSGLLCRDPDEDDDDDYGIDVALSLPLQVPWRYRQGKADVDRL
jgi:hypothetical protein